MRALFWNERFQDLTGEWGEAVCWVARALQFLGFEVLRHPSLRIGSIALGHEMMIETADLVIYSHTTVAHVAKFDGPQWFLKSTAPTRNHFALDPYGYGPHSSIAFDRPVTDGLVSSFKVADWMAGPVRGWIESAASKWGDDILLGGGPDSALDDYALVLGQTIGDETVQGMWWGNYQEALHQAVRELARVWRGPIVVKLHPWTDGANGGDAVGRPFPPAGTKWSQKLADTLSQIDDRVIVYGGMLSVHQFLPRARFVLLCNSGAGLEALLHSKPVIAWGFPEYHWVSYDLRHLCDLGRAIRLDWWDPEAADRFIYWYVEHYCFDGPDRALARVRELLGC